MALGVGSPVGRGVRKILAKGGVVFGFAGGGTNFTCLSEGEKGGNKREKAKIFSRVSKGGLILAVLHHKISFFSAAFGDHLLGGGNSSK